MNRSMKPMSPYIMSLMHSSAAHVYGGKKRKTVQIGTTKKPTAIKQYGDKGYEPSNGIGVGY